jgi:triacylglycerol lipase
MPGEMSLDVWELWLAALALLVVAGLVVRRASHKRLPPELPKASTAHADGDAAPPEPSGPLILLGRPSPTRYPLLLAHGYFGFDAIGVSKARQEYFRGVRSRLESLGYSVHVARVSPAAGIEQRAAQLAQQLQALHAPRVNVIAHSMGGLDARYAIARLGLASRVASLTTIGTPHRGTPLADRATWMGDLKTMRRLLSEIGANVDGLYDLTTEKMEAFNRVVLDAADVRYGSVLAVMQPESQGKNLLLAAGHAYLTRTVGPNDGIVPVASQRWGQVLREVQANHWAQIGWSGGFDARALYVALAEELAAAGM